MEVYSFNEIVCPFASEWKFKKTDLACLKDTKYDYLSGKTSYAIKIHGLQYHIKIYPNGYDLQNGEGTWIILLVTNPTEKDLTMNYTCIIESIGYSKNFDTIFETSMGNRQAACIFHCNTSDFFDSNNNYFIDEEITVKIEGNFKIQRPLISKSSYPISAQWKIKEEILKAATESGRDLISQMFFIPSLDDVQYWITISLNGTKDENILQTEIYLNVKAKGKTEKFEAFFDFSVDSANFYHDVNHIFDKNNGPLLEVGPTLCLTESLFDSSKRYIVDGFLTISLNGIFLTEKNNLDILLNCVNGDGMMPEIFQMPKDFTIVVDDKEIPVHKEVLMNSSPVFIGMFHSGMKEAVENKMEIKGICFEIVEAAINLLYNCNAVRKDFILEDMLSLYKLADRYLITFIMESVENYLVENLSPSNVCQLLNFAKSDSSNAKKLYQSCVDLLIKCSNEHIPVHGLQILDKDLVFEMFLSTFRRVVL